MSTMTNSTPDTTTNDDTPIVGMLDQHYCLTPTELRAMADAAEKMETLNLEGDQTLTLKIDALDYRVTFGGDATGSYGVLGAWMEG